MNDQDRQQRRVNIDEIKNVKTPAEGGEPAPHGGAQLGGMKRILRSKHMGGKEVYEDRK